MLLKLFPILAPCAALIGFSQPEIISVAQPAIVPLLVMVMSFMGLTLTPDDFAKVGQYRGAMLLGMALQFSVMPLTAVCIAWLLQLDAAYTTGLVLVGAVAGGTSSNVMTYLARGNVALSVSMTAISTLLSVVMTPLIMKLTVGNSVPVPAADMLISLVKIILLPVFAGVVLKHFFNRVVVAIESLLAPAAVMAILVIIAIVVSLNADNFSSGVLVVATATLLHNLAGLLFGYLAPYAFGFDRVICRTIAIEVGMQNSGLATALALKFFTPASALPGAIFSIWLNITGSIFAGLARKCDEQGKATSSQIPATALPEKNHVNLGQ